MLFNIIHPQESTKCVGNYDHVVVLTPVRVFQTCLLLLIIGFRSRAEPLSIVVQIGNGETWFYKHSIGVTKPLIKPQTPIAQPKRPNIDQYIF